MEQMTQVLDKGYIRLVDVMGSDLTVVNSAKVSYNKEATSFGENESKLIDFLAKHGHTSPFRHASMQFEIYAPLMVARQWWKYVVGSDHIMDAWNESSRRYVTEEPIFHIPKIDEWREAPKSKKQGSGATISADDKRTYFTEYLEKYVEIGTELYNKAIEEGLATEQARLFLPAYGMYVRWYWTASLASIAHLINQRTSHDAQKEFQEYAKVIREYAGEHFPHSITALTGGN